MFPHLMAHLSVAPTGPGGPAPAPTGPEPTRRTPPPRSPPPPPHPPSPGTPHPAAQLGHRKRRGSRGGRPPEFDALDSRGRNVVERGFCDVNQWRGLATRYDKLATTYCGDAVLRAITIWLKALGDTPWRRS